MSRSHSSRVKSHESISENDSHIIVYWEEQNRYSTLHVSKLPCYISGVKVEKKDVLGKRFDFKWNNGQLYNGEVVCLGSKSEMAVEEERLEKEAVDRSFEAHGDCPTKFFTVVQWHKDGKLSILSSVKLNVEQTNPEDLVGQQMQGQWKGEWLDVTVLAQGSKEEMSAELSRRGDLGSSIRRAKKKSTDIGQVEISNENFVAVELNNVVGDIVNVDKDKIIQELREEVASLKRKCATLEAQNKRLRRLVKKTENFNDSSSLVTIGGGISIPKEVDDYLKLAYAGSPMKFLKQLLIKGEIFTLEELASHSLKGGKSPRVPLEAREKLDPQKLKVAIDYTVASLNLKDEPYNMAKFEINIKDLCTNARKELKKFQEKQPADFELNEVKD